MMSLSVTQSSQLSALQSYLQDYAYRHHVVSDYT